MRISKSAPITQRFNFSLKALIASARHSHWALTLVVSSTLSAATPDFHADVAPILRDYCSACHSGQEREGELNLETYQALKKGGESGGALPEKPGDTSLLDKVIHGKKPAMPPKKEAQIPPTEMGILEAWLKAGAPGPTAKDVSILTLVTVPDLPLKLQKSKAITAATLSPDGRFQAVARYQSVEVQDLATNARVHHFEGLPGKVNQLAFSPDGTRLVAATGSVGINGMAICWDLKDGTPSLKFEGEHQDLVYSARWSPDGTLLATGGYDRRVILWDVTTGKVVHRMTAHTGAVFNLAFSPDGTLLASASADQTVKLWRVKDGERLDTLKEPQGEQFNVSFTPDGNAIVAAGADNKIRVWTLKSRDKAEINPVRESRFAHETTITSLTVLPSGDRLVSAALDRSMKVWSLPGLELVQALPTQPDTITSLQPIDNGNRVLVSRMDGSMERIPVQREKQHNESLARATPITQAVNSESDDSKPVVIQEAEPNNNTDNAQPVGIPSEIHGTIDKAGDVDVFQFSAKKGEELVFEVFAEREKSPLDSRLEVRDEKGAPIERVVLESTHSSWLAFRGKDSKTSDDFRIQHYAEMEINELLYCNGEVVKLWMYPRGPDSGFMVYPGEGDRYSVFDTTPLSHPLGQPVYAVRPLPPGSQPPPNGLPVFRLNYENDDDPSRVGGHDSLLHFTAPVDGNFQVRITDARGFGSEKSSYRLVCRHSRPDFTVSLSQGGKPAVSPGSGREFQIKVHRKDNFDGPISVDVAGLPPGFHATTPIVIEAGQTFAFGSIYADSNATAPEASSNTSRLVATGMVGTKEIRHESPGFSEIMLGSSPKVTLDVLDKADEKSADQPLELTIHPGETITARIRATRLDFKDRIELGKEDSGRNLPHGVYVDNLGLSGLLIPENAVEREFFLTAAKWVPEGDRMICFRGKADGGQTTPPVLLHVRKRAGS